MSRKEDRNQTRVENRDKVSSSFFGQEEDWLFLSEEEESGGRFVYERVKQALGTAGSKVRSAVKEWFAPYEDLGPVGGGEFDSPPKRQEEPERKRKEGERKKKLKEPKKVPDDLELALRRQKLEEKIMKLIGGRSGMIMTWENLLSCAREGDERGFLFYRGPFLAMGEELEKGFLGLQKIIAYARHRLDRSPDPELILSQTAAPFTKEKECEDLLEKRQKLKDSELSTKESITSEELEDWLGTLFEGETRGSLQ